MSDSSVKKPGETIVTAGLSQRPDKGLKTGVKTIT
jgi:hypothetical protein